MADPGPAAGQARVGSEPELEPGPELEPEPEPGDAAAAAAQANQVARVAQLESPGEPPALDVHTLRELMTKQRNKLGEAHPTTLQTTTQLALAHARLGEFSTGIPLLRQALRMLMQTLGPKDHATLTCMRNLGSVLADSAEFQPAIELLKEATMGMDQALGRDHPDTQSSMDLLNDVARRSGMVPGPPKPAAAPAPAPAPAPAEETMTPRAVIATVAGLANAAAAELNGCSAEVQSWNEEKGRYLCRVRKGDGSHAKTHIKPPNLLLPPGTAVTVCGVTGAAELNGRAGVTGEFAAEKGRYSVRVEGRKKPAGLKPENVRVQT